ncbi:MAG: hypothetical protein FJ291_24630 [Planctomycetes bacterium]|nr:hypothetical protein [Planctomycetota bacterium]
MSTVFIGGSRRIARLDSVIRAKLESIVQRSLRVVVGDANGADRAVQAFLAERRYAKVVVYCMKAGCRNNLGGWPEHVVEANGERGFDYYALKDAEMARNADCGFMIWDAESRGTLFNVLRLVESGKPVAVYFSPTRECSTIRTKADLDALLSRCSEADRKRLRRVLGGAAVQAPLFAEAVGGLLTKGGMP